MVCVSVICVGCEQKLMYVCECVLGVCVCAVCMWCVCEWCASCECACVYVVCGCVCSVHVHVLCVLCGMCVQIGVRDVCVHVCCAVVYVVHVCVWCACERCVSCVCTCAVRMWGVVVYVVFVYLRNKNNLTLNLLLRPVRFSSPQPCRTAEPALWAPGPRLVVRLGCTSRRTSQGPGSLVLCGKRDPDVWGLRGTGQGWEAVLINGDPVLV